MFITGRAVALFSLGIIPMLLAPSLQTLGIWSAIVALAVAIDALLAVNPRLLTTTRAPLAPLRVYTTTRTQLSVHNPTSRPVRILLRDAWPPSATATPNRHTLKILPGQRQLATTPLAPTRRGTLRAAHVSIRSFGPLALAGRQHTRVSPGKLTVLPEFSSRIHLPSRIERLRELDGATLVNIRGAGSEFDSLREYTYGDDVRAIDWMSSARRADVLVRTWRPERDRRVVIVVDASRTSAARLGDSPRIDASIEAALLLTALAHEAGDRVEIVAYHRTEIASTQADAGTHALATVGQVLADVQPELAELNWNGLVALLQKRLSQRALVVLLTAPVAASPDALVSAVSALSHKHQVLIGAATDPEVTTMTREREDSEAVYQAAAASRTELRQGALGRVLRNLGAEVTFAEPEQLPPALADAYLDLKRQGRL